MSVSGIPQAHTGISSNTVQYSGGQIKPGLELIPGQFTHPN